MELYPAESAFYRHKNLPLLSVGNGAFLWLTATEIHLAAGPVTLLLSGYIRRIRGETRCLRFSQ